MALRAFWHSTVDIRSMVSLIMGLNIGETDKVFCINLEKEIGKKYEIHGITM